MLKLLRELLNLKQIEDDLSMLKEEVDQLRELTEAALTRGQSRDTDNEGDGWLDRPQAVKVLHSEGEESQ